jgi:hypothetical protein
LKCLSASTGLIISLLLIWKIGPVAAKFSDIDTSFAVVEKLILVLSCFILSSTLTSIFGRLSMMLWNLFRYLTLKLKNFSGTLPNERRNV